MPVETVIRGGQIATAEATYRAEIGIEDGRISVIADRVEGDNVIDASGCIVVPGGIDVHTHFDTQIGDMRTADDYESGSRAAAFGGVTTFVNYAFQGDGESLADALAREAGKAATKSYVDYSFHPVITRVDADVLGEFEAVRDDGFTSVKVFTAVPDFEVADRDVLAILRRASETGMLVNVHAEDGALIDHLTDTLLEAGETEVDALPRARPDVAEGLATEKLGHLRRPDALPDLLRPSLVGLGARRGSPGAPARRRDLHRDAAGLPVPRRGLLLPAEPGGAQVRGLAPAAPEGRPGCALALARER